MSYGPFADAIASQRNLAKVLEAFWGYRLGSRHFAGSTGYGHDNLGRETLDGIFARVVGVEAALVRGHFVSGTPAIACALFGVLCPGDEMLVVAGSPYDTLVLQSRISSIMAVAGNRGGRPPENQWTP